MNTFDKQRKIAERLREQYPVGTRIELIHMEDPYTPIPSGTRGTVRAVDDMGTIHCDFDNGRQLGIIPDEDNFRKLTAEEIEEEQSQDSGFDMQM